MLERHERTFAPWTLPELTGGIPDGWSDDTIGPVAEPTLQDRIVVVVNTLLQRLAMEKIPCCLLRNRGHIPDGLIRGGDIDLCVPSGTDVRHLLAVIADLGLVHVVSRREVIHTYLRVTPHFLLHVDFRHIDTEWLGARYLGNNAMLRQRHEDSGIPVASMTHQAFLAWFDSLVWGGFFKARYAPLVYAGFEHDPVAMDNLLCETFGRKLGSQFLTLLEEHRLEDSVHLVKRARCTLWTRQLLRRPIAALTGWFDHFSKEIQLRTRARPAGISLAIVGPDGSGKTSVCKALLASPKGSLPFSDIELTHLYRPVLPALGRLRHGKIRTPPYGGIVTDPHGNPPHGTLMSSAALLYYTIDQVLSDLIWGRHQIAKNMLRVHDRHRFEVGIDPRRYRYGGPAWLLGLVSRVIPKPDIVVFVDVPLMTLRRRKSEVTFPESLRQLDDYRAVIESMPNGFIVDGTPPVEDVADEVRRIVLGYVESRARQHYPLEN